MKAVSENCVELILSENHMQPKSNQPFFNTKMRANREFVLLTLAVLSDYKDGIIECFDGFAATGVTSLQWKHHLGDRVSVYACDQSVEACVAIDMNAKRNKMSTGQQTILDLTDEPVLIDESDTPRPDITMINSDCSLVMIKKAFDFIHLDPFGTTVYFLESAFRRLRHGGILTLTSTDVASLFARSPQVVLRNYGATVVKTTSVKEVATRVVIAAAVRAAARCNKGVNVLYSLSSDHFILIALQVVRGVHHADKCLSHISQLLHCRLCQESVFMPANQLAPVEDPCSFLPCQCKKTNPGQTAVLLGPMWNADIFNFLFIQRMTQVYNHLIPKLSDAVPGQMKTTLIHNLPPALKFTGFIANQLELMLNEASFGIQETTSTQKKGDNVHRSTEEEKLNDTQCLRKNPSLCLTTKIPPFYHLPSRMQLNSTNIPKMSVMHHLISSAGFTVSRTHFDTTAIRTNASLVEVKKLIELGAKSRIE